MSDETSSRGPDVVQKNNDAMLEADSVTMVTESAVVESIQGKRRLDVAEWLKNLKLHKYTPELTKYSWEQLFCLTDAELEEEGLTIGARRKLLREAENLKRVSVNGAVYVSAESLLHNEGLDECEDIDVWKVEPTMAVPELSMVEQQAARTFLRERFLWLFTSIADMPIDIALCNHNKVSASFGACDVDVLHVQVNNLETPIGKQPSAILRTSDIVSFTVKYGQGEGHAEDGSDGSRGHDSAERQLEGHLSQTEGLLGVREASMDGTECPMSTDEIT